MSRRFAANLVVALILVVACSPATSSGTPQETTPAASPSEAPEAPVVVTVGATADNYTENPEQSFGLNIGRFTPVTNIFEPLTRLSPTYEAEPLLAESFDYDSATYTWTFNLRPGVKFHNGDTLTAKAVVQTLDRFLVDAAWQATLGLQPGAVSASDDLTVQITSKEPNFALPSNLAHPQLGIDAPDIDVLKEYVGTGPFRFVEWVKDDHFSVERNSDYWGEPASIDRLDFRFIPDANARILALQAGEVDLLSPASVQPSLVESLGPDFNLIAIDPTGFVQLNVILTRDGNPLKDIRLREAMGYALDREAFVLDFGGYATTEPTILPPAVFGSFANTIVGYQFDQPRASQLLDEAGWKDADGDGIREKDGEKLSVELIAAFPTQASLAQRPEIVQAQLREVGIDVVIVPAADTPSAIEALSNKTGDMWISHGNFNSGTCGIIGELWRAEPGVEWNPFQGAVAPFHAGILTSNEAAADCNAASSAEELQEAAARAVKGVVDEARSVIPIVRPQSVWVFRKGLTFEPPTNERYVNWTGLSVES